jgi:hypothetical protein
MPRSLLAPTLTVCLLLPVTAGAQAPRGSAFDRGVPSLQIALTRDSVERILAALPEITSKTSAHQAQFMGNLTGGLGPGGAPQLTPEEINELRAIFTRHGFTMEEFAMQVSALLATYLILSPEAFEKQLPSEDKPEVQAILNDPSISAEKKKSVRSRIAFARENKDKIREQLAALASPENQKVVKPLLPKVKQAFEAAEEVARKAMQGNEAGPRRAKTK